MIIREVKINGITNPVGFDLNSVRISWKVDKCSAKYQKYVRIEVSEHESFDQVIYELEGENLDSTGQIIAVKAEPHMRYFVRVNVTGDNGESAESEINYFECGKGEEPVLASFIGTHETNTYHPVFIKDFEVKQNVVKARLYVTGLGLYEAYINNNKVGDDLLAPFCNDYNDHIQYQTYDVMDMLQEKSQIQITTGNGWYKGRLGYDGAEAIYGNRFAVWAELHIWYENGEKEVITTDDQWSYKGSDIASSDIYDGEVFDRLLWEDEENALKKAVELDMDASRLIERYSLPVIPKETIDVKEVIKTPKGETVLDFGQNFTGYVAFHSKLLRGTKITLDYGEILQEGNFYNDNYRTAKSQFTYVSDGREEYVRPHFTFYGFRYVRVSGWPEEIDANVFEGVVLYSDLDTTSEFKCSSASLNQLASNCMWGQKSNFLDMPTDCPQRDERLGWTGDAQVFAPTACYNMDTRAFYHKFLYDIRIEQKKQNGSIPNFIPVLPGLPAGSSVWGDIATFLPMVLYRHYGDKEELGRHYPMMKDWVDYIIRIDKENGEQNLWNTGFHFGDWLAQDGISPQSMKGGTDDYLIASIYYYESVKKTAEAAKILGFSNDEVYYTKKRQAIREAILSEYFTPTGRLAINTQTAYLICLKFGVYHSKEKVITDLKERLRKDCYKIKGGFVGAPMMCQILAENGMEDIASYVLFQEGFPGWMHCINLGATTIWERWNSVLDDGRISGTDMNSLNHYAYGSVMEYVYAYMAGIKETVAGFKKVSFAPQLNNKLKWMKYSYDSVSGRYTSMWEINKDGSVTITFEVPFGCSAVAKLPSSDEGEKVLEPGKHVFNYMPKVDYRKKYSMETRLIEMMDDEEAMKILREKLPLAAAKIEGKDVEDLNTSLEELQFMFFLGFNPPMVQETAKDLMLLE